MYLINMILVSFLFLFFLSSNLISKYGMPKLLVYIKRYNSLYLLYLLFFLSLSGIPPLSFFFIKLNILVSISSNLISINFLIIFFIMILNTFFYLQIFYHTNTALVNLDILKNQKKKTPLNLVQLYHLEVIQLLLFIFFFIIFFFFFFLDVFFIIFSFII